MPAAESPNVTVVTLAWRNEQYAERFSKTLMAAIEVAGSPVQVICVVNGPEGAAAAAVLRALFANSNVDLEVREVGKNVGFTGGMNEGASQFSGDVLVLANLDIEFGSNFFVALDSERSANDWDALVPDVRQGLVHAGAARKSWLHRLQFLRHQPANRQPVSFGNGSCMILRRDVVARRKRERGALFDAEMGSFNEDIELYWWMSRSGCRVIYSPSLVISHAVAGSFPAGHSFRRRPEWTQVMVMANYRVTVWQHARGVEWVGAAAGEITYLLQAVRAAGPVGLARYLKSWSRSLTVVTEIKRRRQFRVVRTSNTRS